MRRLLAIALLLIFGFAGAAPLLANAVEPASRLPLCCRQGGLHHCVGMVPDGQTVARAACPALPLLVSPLPNRTAYRKAPALLSAPGTITPVCLPCTVDEQRSGWLEARDSRGPPLG